MPDEVTILENKIHRIHKMLNEENLYKEDPIRAKKAEQELKVMENIVWKLSMRNGSCSRQKKVCF